MSKHIPDPLKVAYFLLFAVMPVVLCVATFVEQSRGTVFAAGHIYHSWWFVALWAVVAAVSLVAVVRCRLWHRRATFALHVSLLSILAGAAVSFATSRGGVMNIGQGQTQNMFLDDNNSLQQLPFALCLDSFHIKYYPGTDAPSDYLSHVEIINTVPSSRNTAPSAVISMNRILRHEGYRFYQSSYDNDCLGTVLAVRYDPWGTPLTCCGYIMLALSMLAVLFSSGGRFRLMLKQLDACGPVGAGCGSAVRSVTPLRLIFVLMFVSQAVFYIVRWHAGGHVPLANAYEAMLFLSLVVMAVSAVLSRRFPPMLGAGLLLSGVTLLAAHFSYGGSSAEPLMPVLNSPLLFLHVSLVIMAYSLLCIMSVLAVAFFVRGAIGKRKAAKQASALDSASSVLTLISRMLLYPAEFLLAAGIFVGAVWANVSWGTYWSWDPKEVWALITMLVYAVPFHLTLHTPHSTLHTPLSTLHTPHPTLNSARFFHFFVLAAFLTVLMTYFGVNLFLGGMHAYV